MQKNKDCFLVSSEVKISSSVWFISHLTQIEIILSINFRQNGSFRKAY